MSSRTDSKGLIVSFIFLKGILLLVAGLVLVFFPTASLSTLMVVVGVYWLFDGIATIVRAIKGKEKYNSWGILSGILGIIAGGLVLSKPYLVAVFTASFFIWIIGISAIIYGLTGFFSGFKLQKGSTSRKSMIFGGAFSVILGIALISSPYFSILTIIYLIGTIAIISGISILLLARSIK